VVHWFGGQGQVSSAENAKTYPNYDVTHKKPQNSKIVISKTTRLHEFVEGLHSSLA